MPLNVLICGGGIAGPALAFWLSRAGHRVVIVERFPVLRASGAQVDIRGQGVDTIKRMGIIDAIRAKVVEEDGFSFVNSHGAVQATLMANKTGTGAQSFTSEFEIMRGNLVRVLYDATRDRVEYRFGLTVDRYDESQGDRVVAHFSDGSSEAFDLLVGADGQGSRIRRAMLGTKTDHFRHLDTMAAYYFVPRIATDSSICDGYIATNGRFVLRRSPTPDLSQVYLMLPCRSDAERAIAHAPAADQKRFWADAFRGAGWQTDRFLAAIDTGDDFYCHEVVQVRIDRWHQPGGRVALLGDAGYCPSPMSGMGTSLGFVGAYVLAGELCSSPDDLPAALDRYERTLRPFVDEVQLLRGGGLRRLIPHSSWGITVFHYCVWLLTVLRIPDLLMRFASDDRGSWKLPDYPVLKGEKGVENGV